MKNSFLKMKKKKFRFKVKLSVIELSSVPLVSGILFVKIRLKESNKFKEFTSRREVENHVVRWDKQVELEVPLTADQHTGVLEECSCRLSVRKESKGGKTTKKLGYVDLNLAEYAGQGSINRNFILQGYNDKHRLDNSLLRISVHMTLMSGDPLFKVPQSITHLHSLLSISPSDDLTQENKGDNSESPISPVSNNKAARLPSRNGSLHQISPSSSESVSLVNHTRTPSQVSDSYKQVITYVPAGAGHTRNPSMDRPGHIRSHSSGSNKVILSSRKFTANSERDQRIDSTRVNTDGLVDELFGGVSLDDSHSEKGLRLVIKPDGSATVTGHTSYGTS